MIPQTLQAKIELLLPTQKEELELFLDFLISKTKGNSNLKRTREFGSVKGKLWMADDFDAPIPGFESYIS